MTLANNDLGFDLWIGAGNYRVLVRHDEHRGGYVAKLISSGIGVIAEPNGRTPKDALDRLVKELVHGEHYDQKLADEIQRARAWRAGKVVR